MAPNDSLSYKLVNSDVFWATVNPHFKSAFSNRLESSSVGFYNEDSVEPLKLLRKNLNQLYSLHVLLYLNDEFIGWHVGEQVGPETYYMRNSAILESYRGHSYYEQLLLYVLNTVTAQGFQLITSTHHPNNPAVLIPKLRHGFIITSTEFHDRFGFLVHLKYFVNKVREKSYFHRIGLE